MNIALESLYLKGKAGPEATFDRGWVGYENFLKKFVVENITGTDGFISACGDAEEALNFENHLNPRKPDSIEVLRHIIEMAIFVEDEK
jgi:hypothetical protein